MQSRRPPAQIPLTLPHDAALSRDDLVVSAANREAVGMVDRWPGWPAPVLVLAGPEGSGKSHLAAIWRERAGGHVLKAATLPAAFSDLAPGAAVLIEDADRGNLDEAALFHLINQTRASGGSLLLTARRLPASWPVALPDLASRLRAAATVEIGAPDDALLSGVIAKLFADRQVEVDPAVIGYIVRRMERSLAAANAVVDRLDRVALERGQKITRALAAEIIAPPQDGQAELDL